MTRTETLFGEKVMLLIKDNITTIKTLHLIKESIDTESLAHNPKGVKALKDLYDKVIKESIY